MGLDRYSCQQIDASDIEAVTAVLKGDWLTQGPAVPAFEAALAEYVGATYAIAFCNATAALEVLYTATVTSRIVTTPLTFLATANAALRAGKVVTITDVDRATGNMAPRRRVDVLVPVHFAGRACNLSTFEEAILEDACHALGAWDWDGCSRIGSCKHSLATVFSFHPVKPITTGEGGAVTTNDASLAAELRSLRDHGRENGLMVRLGTNARMTDLQAALGLSQLRRCHKLRAKREFLAKEYDRVLKVPVTYSDPDNKARPDRWTQSRLAPVPDPYRKP